jgi:hypothetical protein
MSLESAIDEERREVMNILEGRPTQYNTVTADTGRTSSPAPPVRSMLDIGPATARHGSIAGSAVGVITPPLRSAPLTRSMLDPSSSPPQQIISSTEGGVPSGHHRAHSDASTIPPRFRPRAGSDRERGSGSLPYAENQFDMSKSVHGQALPKRVTQGGKKGLGISSMASIMQGQELDPLPMTRDQGRHNSTAGIMGLHSKSKSPSSRLSNRSQSPGLNTNSFNLMSTPGTFVTDSGKVIDMNNAYRRLSDANFLKSGGQLSNLSTNAAERAINGETLSSNGELRLQKDYYENGEGGEAAIESSDEEHTSDEEGWSLQNGRGRRRSRRKKGVGTDADNGDSDNESNRSAGPAGMGQSGGPKAAKSLLAAAEEESELNFSMGLLHDGILILNVQESRFPRSTKSNLCWAQSPQ